MTSNIENKSTFLKLKPKPRVHDLSFIVTIFKFLVFKNSPQEGNFAAYSGMNQ
jgi:hypothetical protein